MFLFSCKEDIKLSSEATMTTLTLTVEGKDYEITFTNKQGKIKLPYSTKLPVTAKVAAVALSAKATGVKVGDEVTISASGTVTLTVTAEDKTTTQAYTVTVEKADPISEAAITSLTLTVGSTDYEVDFTDGAYTLILLAGSTIPSAVEVKQIELSSGATSDAGTELNVTNNAVTITVTAEDKKTTSTYTVTLSVAASVGASITSLTLTVGSTDYKIDFTDGAYTLILLAGSTIPSAVEVKQIELSSGATSDAGTELNVTNNAVTITVTAEDKKTTSTYTVTLSVAASVGASITSLTLTVGSRDYDIMFEGTQGTVVVPYDTEIPAEVVVKEIVLSEGATSVDQGTQLSVTNNAVTITVTAEDDKTTSMYTVTLSVAANSEASITTLILKVGEVDYDIPFTDRQGTMTLPYSTEIPAQVEVKEIALSDGATSVDQGTQLSVTDNTVTITVTAEDGETTQAYTVIVENADPLSSEAAITSLTLTVGATDYEITFTGRQDTLLRIGPLGTPVPATVEVKEIALSSGATSVDQGAQLTVTDNAVTITVTAEDKTTQAYTVVLGFTTAGITSFTFEVPDNESMALDTADRKRIVGMIDHEAKTITFDKQSAYVYRDNLIATFEVSEAGAAVQVGGADQESGTTGQDFSAPVSYVVSAESMETTTYRVTLTKSTLATIPDEQFRAKLKELVPDAFTGDELKITHNTVINNNGALDVNTQTPKLTSLKGIEFFRSLKDLNCSVNALPSLNVSRNTSLANLACNTNALASLDVSRNTALTELYCGRNSLSVLNVRANTALTTLWCDDNNLQSLDVRANTALTTLDCGRNSLTSLDLSKNTALTYLDCYKNRLTSLDMTGMRGAALTNVNIGAGTGTDNPLLATLRVNAAIQDISAIVRMKTGRGTNLTITTVNNDGDVVCTNYTPADNGGNCNDTP